MYRPRHARPPRLRVWPVVLTVTAGYWGPPSHARATTAPTLALVGQQQERTFPATPVDLPLVQGAQAPVHPAIPDRAALLLPASTLTPLEGRPTPVPPAAVAAYRAAAREVAQAGCHLSWRVLAGVGAVVSDHGRHTRQVLLDGRAGALMTDSDGGRYDGSARVDGPVGPLGLLPWTFERLHVSPEDDPHELDDAARAAARFLCAAGDQWSATSRLTALAAYDETPGFADAVLSAARGLRS